MMKFLGAFVLLISIFNLAFCRPTIEQVINAVAPQILENGVNKGVLSAGGYYLHHIIKASTPTDNLYSLNLHLRNLNNQTRVDLKASVDNDFNIQSWYYNYSIIKGTRNLGEGMGFAWLNYASSSTSEFCSKIRNFEEARNLINGDGSRYLPNENFKVRSSFKDVYDYSMEQYGDFLLPVSDIWKTPEMGYFIPVRFEPDYYVMSYAFMQASYGDWVRQLQITSIYQPCSGKIYSYDFPWDSSE